MTDYFKASERNLLFRRFDQLRGDTKSRSGRVTGHQLIRHLINVLREILGDVPAATRGTLLHRTVLKWLVFHLIPWPEREPANDLAMQAFVGNTPAGSFEEDYDTFVALLKRFDEAIRDDRVPSHPLFGALSRAEWGEYMFLHFDYHLTLFDIHGDFRDRVANQQT